MYVSSCEVTSRALHLSAVTVHDILLCLNWLPSQVYMFYLIQLKVAPLTHWEMQSRPLLTWRSSLIAMEMFYRSQMLINFWKLQRAFRLQELNLLATMIIPFKNHAAMRAGSFNIAVFCILSELLSCTYTFCVTKCIPIANCNVTSSTCQFLTYMCTPIWRQFCNWQSHK